MLADLHDPAVALTDAFLAIECTVLSIALRHEPRKAGVFAALGASSLLGGLYHGLFPAKTTTLGGFLC